MCTLGAKKINGRFLVFKNRDLENYKKTYVKQEKDVISRLLVVDDGGNCEGMNEYNICITKATLHPNPRRKYTIPSRVVRKALTGAKTINQAIKILKESSTSANFIVSNGKKAVILEKTPTTSAITNIKEGAIVTNHGIKLKDQYGYARKSVQEWSHARIKRGTELVKKVKTKKDIINLLGDKEDAPKRRICTPDSWCIATRFSMIYDPAKKKIDFCKGKPKQGRFKEYKFKR